MIDENNDGAMSVAIFAVALGFVVLALIVAFVFSYSTNGDLDDLREDFQRQLCEMQFPGAADYRACIEEGR